ncbi:HNH endonuclease [Paenibacillus sp. CFBP13512]|uniref:HNH endonuclease n=1 Tax=Paenibacillus sp. CFBP13512 TaxID=2184007 RepID=UPI0010C03A98|nr:HNH endonuclease [Paenibacillus sp. CFBP13512]TKJ83655.1 HNH endonuclease [Paenibacillus sp. CFBP13512]
MKWLIPANAKIYNHVDAFDNFGYIDWRQKVNYKIGDIIYIYATIPYQKVMFKTVVEKTNMKSNEITDDREYWNNFEDYQNSLSGEYARLRLIERMDSERLSLYELKKNGLKAAPQSPMKVKEGLEEYLEKYFNDYYSEGVFPEEIRHSLEEGHRHLISVNKYERSSVARQKCIEENGLNCAVCDMNFEEVYGEIGKGFIHVHHIVPLHEVGGRYKVDYKKDLVCVCPNCHAMLHRNVDGKTLDIKKLKEFYQLSKQK